MIPFDLEKAKKGHTVRTRNGNKAVFNAHLQGGQPAPLLFDIYYVEIDPLTGNLIDEPSQFGKLENYYLDGRHGTIHDSPLDLFMED